MSGCFYENGLRFECQRCLYCCSAEPGYVYLSREDIISGANATALSPRDFISVYCRVIDFGTFSMVSLKEKENYDCIFLTKDGCSIYQSRPLQCRTYPFWPSVIESRESWEREGRSCPGIGKGKALPREEIERRASLRTEPYMIFNGKDIWQE